MFHDASVALRRPELRPMRGSGIGAPGARLSLPPDIGETPTLGVEVAVLLQAATTNAAASSAVVRDTYFMVTGLCTGFVRLKIIVLVPPGTCSRACAPCG